MKFQIVLVLVVLVAFCASLPYKRPHHQKSPHQYKREHKKPKKEPENLKRDFEKVLETDTAKMIGDVNKVIKKDVEKKEKNPLALKIEKMVTDFFEQLGEILKELAKYKEAGEELEGSGEQKPKLRKPEEENLFKRKFFRLF